MSEPRKHHYLPQFYLRNFSLDERSICQIVKVKTSDAQQPSYMSAIRDTAAVRDYHKLDYEGAENPNDIEQKLAKVEGQLAITVQRTLESGVDGKEVREVLPLLVPLLMMRVPHYKVFIEDLLRATVSAVGLMMQRKGELPPVPKKLKEILSFENLQVKIHNWICVEYMYQLACDPEVLGLFSAMHLSLWRTNCNGELLTCDNPVSVFRPDAKRTDCYGTGIGDRRVEISLPIARDALLLLTWNHDAPREGQLDETLVREYNRRTIVSADKVVFASTDKEEFLGIVDELRHCSTSIEIETVDSGNEILHLTNRWPVMPPEEYQR